MKLIKYFALFLSILFIHIYPTEKKKMNEKNTIKTQINQKPNRHQNPQPPYPYDDQEVNFENKTAGITLSGTLTLPKANGPFPIAILLAGMGPMDRDGTFNDHKPLLIIADHLARKGIATLRFDKRGSGKSTGTFDLNITTKNLASDVLSSIEYLKTENKIDLQRLGLIGHSEGGLIATMVASESNDVSFVVLMAGAIAHLPKDLADQVVVQLKADGASEKIIELDHNFRIKFLETIKQQLNVKETEKQLRKLWSNYWVALSEKQKEESEKLLFAFSETKIENQINMMNSPWYRFLLQYNHTNVLKKVSVPLLAINGSLDFMAPHLVFPIIKKAMEESGNTDYTTLELPNLNHSFQTCKTGAIEEYATIEETIAPLALNTISKWILQKI